MTRSVLAFEERLEENLLSLRDDLRGGAYVHGAYRCFTVQDSKKRSIMAAPFRDRVMHHALCAVIEPIFDRGLIYDSYACRTAKGTHRGVARLRQFMRRSDYGTTYIFQGDISKYFDSIDHEVLFGLIKRKISDAPTLCLIRTIIDSARADTGVGIPIGNLTSQLFANIYLNELDQFVKHTLRATRYIRYMDDFLILDTDKRVLAGYREAIAQFVAEHLHLCLHPRKSIIAPVRLGVDFLGYRLFEHHTRLRTSTVKRFVKRTKQAARHLAAGELPQALFDTGITSWQAYADYANSWRLRKALGARLGIELIRVY